MEVDRNLSAAEVGKAGKEDKDTEEDDIDPDTQEIRDAFKKSSSRFTCSGSMKWPNQFVIFYQTKGDKRKKASLTRKLRLPASAEAELTDLVDACDVASFGMGKKEVTDESYRKAYQLGTDKFAALSNIGQTGILHSVQKILAPDCEYIIAEPYKLNIYAEGGFFKVHKDTPRASNMFGSLVVTLPQSHTGGDLVVNHQGNVYRHSPLNDIEQEESIQWIAFYSDCDHEVQKVTSGMRITLTFNLYRGNTRPNSPDVELPVDNKLYKAMGRLIPSMSPNTFIGFPLEYLYATDSQPAFKGRDLVLFNTLARHGNFKVEAWLAVRVPSHKIEVGEQSSSRAAGSDQLEANEFLFIGWNKFQNGGARYSYIYLESMPRPSYAWNNELELGAKYFIDSYDAQSLPVKWAQEPAKFLYEDTVGRIEDIQVLPRDPSRRSRSSSYDLESKWGTETLHAAGCLLVTLQVGSRKRASSP